MPGKSLPVRSFGIRSSTVPARVSQSRSLEPLPWASRSGVFIAGPGQTADHQHHQWFEWTFPLSAMPRYSITSSAVASREDGISTPITLAVLRLIIASYLVGS